LLKLGGRSLPDPLPPSSSKVGVEQQEVDDVRNKWTGLFESFE